jgi:hypothetical protein
MKVISVSECCLLFPYVINILTNKYRKIIEKMNDEGLIEDKEYNHYEYRKEKLNQFLNDQEEANNQENQIIGQLSPIISNLFNGQAIYTLTAEDIKMFRKAPSSILIEDGGIRFYFD